MIDSMTSNILSDRNFHLRLLESEDLPLRVKWINNWETNSMLGFEWPVSLSQTKNWFAGSLSDMTKKHFVAVDSDSNVVFAMAGLLGIDKWNKHAESYVTIGDQAYRQKGLAPKILNVLSRFSFEVSGLERLIAYILEDNTPSRKTFEKAGYRYEGLLRKHRFKNGTFHNVCIYGLLKADWIELQ